MPTNNILRQAHQLLTKQIKLEDVNPRIRKQVVSHATTTDPEQLALYARDVQPDIKKEIISGRVGEGKVHAS